MKKTGIAIALLAALSAAPSFAQQLPIGKGPGLAEFLANEATAASLVTPVHDWNISVISAGSRWASSFSATLSPPAGWEPPIA